MTDVVKIDKRLLEVSEAEAVTLAKTAVKNWAVLDEARCLATTLF